MDKIDVGAQDFIWDLSSLYKNIDDENLDRDVQKVVDQAKAFQETFRGVIGKKLGEALGAYIELDCLTNKIFYYLHLERAVHLDDEGLKTKLSSVEKTLLQAFGEYVEFFRHEIIELDDKAVEALSENDEFVGRYMPWIEDVRRDKPHFLPELVESALTKRSMFGPGSWSMFYDDVESELRFSFDDRLLTLTEILDIVNEGPDADQRAQALKVLNEGLKTSFSKLSAQALWMIVGAKSIEDKERAYKHPMESRNKDNKIPDSVVNALHEVVTTEGSSLAQRFYALKAKHLKKEILRWSDRNAKLPFSDTSIIQFDDAYAIVYDAYKSFSPTMAGLVKGLRDKHRIHAPVQEAKESGAFSASTILPGDNPFSCILLNYLGSSRDVMTLAHELGHSVHGLLGAQKQGPLMFHAPIAFAETASVFGEMITFTYLREQLIKKGDNESLFALLMEKIDDILNTVVRQIGFSHFEQRVHDAGRRLSAKELGDVWMGTLHELYGDEGDIFTYDDVEYLWTYVSHFHRPFYVYGYACGELFTHSLYAERERLGNDFEGLYLDLLRAGNTRDMQQLLKPFGLDGANETFWKKGIDVSLGALLEEAESISRELD